MTYSFTAEEIARALPLLKRSHFDLNGKGTIYLRLAARAIDSIGLRTIDIGDVTVHEAARMQGVFSNALLVVEAAAVLLDRDAVYVQQIVNPVIPPALWRRGYVLCVGIGTGKPAPLDMFKPVFSPTEQNQ